MAAGRKVFTVDYAGGVCVREKPSTEAKILRVLAFGEKVKPATKAEAPDGWLAVDGGGYTMTKFLR